LFYIGEACGILLEMANVGFVNSVSEQGMSNCSEHKNLEKSVSWI
jgi:hypothetical protein